MNGRNKTRQQKILPVSYSPAASYDLDIEVIRASALRRRAPAEHWSIPQRVDFNLFVCVDRGRFLHELDFTPVVCESGSILMIHPGQIHVWDMHSAWEGWVIIARPELIKISLPARDAAKVGDDQELLELPSLLKLTGRDYEAVAETARRMHADAGNHAELGGLQKLLRAQLNSLVIRLSRHHRLKRMDPPPPAMATDRFQVLRAAVDRHFSRLHSVAQYASLLGCTERTLQRAASACTDHSAKALICRRITLEAKRLLAHGDAPVSRISEDLGFSEATNFVKFFRREAGLTPGEFRQKHGARWRA